jgi:hypothetical protein
MATPRRFRSGKLRPSRLRKPDLRLFARESCCEARFRGRYRGIFRLEVSPAVFAQRLWVEYVSRVE